MGRLSLMIFPFLMTVLLVASQNNGPPEMSTKKWDVVYLHDPKVRTCIAKGAAPLRYKWMKDGIDVRVKRPGDGNTTLWYVPSTGVINLPAENGIYQCQAENGQGSALSDFLYVHVLAIGPFPAFTNIDTQSVTRGKYLKLICKDKPTSIPPAKMSWFRERTVLGKLQKEPVPGPLDRHRIIVDPEGNLHFLWVEDDDGAQWSYFCSANNERLGVTADSQNPITITVNSGSYNNRDPELVYNKDVEVQKGQRAKLVCIFKYYSKDSFKVIWEKWDTDLSDEDKYEIAPDDVTGGTLIVKDAQFPLENEPVHQYTCKAQMGSTITQGYKVNLKVVGPPQFHKNGALKSNKVPVGDDAVFQCSTFSHNTVNGVPTWYNNGEHILGCPPLPKDLFECKARGNDGRSVCIPDNKVCNDFNDCIDGSDEVCPGSKSCTEGEILCNDKCISAEITCVPFELCKPNQFACPRELLCLEKEDICSPTKNCSDLADEQNCAYSQPIVVPGRPAFEFSGDRTTVTIKKVTKSFNMCLQCTVENYYGITFGDGCLTVIDRISIVYQPNDTYTVSPGDILNMGILATTDESLQYSMGYKWYMEGRGENHDEQIELPSTFVRYFRMSQKSRNLTIEIPNKDRGDDDWASIYQMILGNYSIHVSHDYETVVLYFFIKGNVLPPVKVPTVAAASLNLWFIALIVGILLLFIVVALIICYMYRNRGGTYPLGKKEHQAGHNPEQELKDSGFHDAGRVDDDYDDEKPRLDEVSLSESVQPYESDEDITEEYGGDFDVTKFNEDGSFIGLYGDKKSKSSRTKDSTV